MKKQALKAVTMLVSIIALAFMTAVMSSAQSRGQKIRANIPFDFVIGDKTLAADKYSVETITSSSNEGILVRSLDGRQSAMRLSNGVESSRSRAIHPEPKMRVGRRVNSAMLTFHRYGSTYFLAQVWTPGSSEGRELLKSKAESELERELAMNPSRNELAQNAQPETVTIFAELQ